MFLNARAPRTVVDPADSDLTAVSGAHTFSDPARIPDAPTTRFVPRDPFDLDCYAELYRRLRTMFPRFVWCDEAGIVFPVNRTPAPCATLVVQDRKREIGHLALHTRPREVHPALIALAPIVITFDLPNPDDRDRIADLAGIKRPLLEELMGGLPQYGFIHWDRRAKTLTVCDPLPH